MNNPVHWFEIAAKDLERAKDFYSEVFNLEFQYVEMLDTKMYMFGEPGKPGSSGALVQSEDNTPSQDGTLVYFSCEDIPATTQKVEKMGGKTLVSKTSIGEFGFYAHVSDTEGNRIGLHSNQ